MSLLSGYCLVFINFSFVDLVVDKHPWHHRLVRCLSCQFYGCYERLFLCVFGELFSTCAILNSSRNTYFIVKYILHRNLTLFIFLDFEVYLITSFHFKVLTKNIGKKLDSKLEAGCPINLITCAQKFCRCAVNWILYLELPLSILGTRLFTLY